MAQFDQFANQGGPESESADALAEARRKADEQLRTADYSGDLPEPLSGGEHGRGSGTPAGQADQSDASGSDADGSDANGSDANGSDASSSDADGSGPVSGELTA